MVINDCIIRASVKQGIPLIDLRAVCDEDESVGQNPIANMPGFTLPPSHADRPTRSTTCH
jgi:hypothetical protein